jgi:hypothetical protein
MTHQRSFRELSFCAAGIALAGGGAISMLAGCSRVEEIKHYTVEKPAVLEQEYFGASGRPQKSDGLDGMLGAIVPRGQQLWFFKLVGPNEAVAAQATPFARFIDSLNFKDAADSPPEWKLPEGWTQEPGSGMRYATIAVDSPGKKLDLSVTTFPKPEGNEDSAILLNVNRWRGQLGLEKIAAAQLAEKSKSVKLPFGRAVVVFLVGHMQSGGMGGPMAGGGPFSGGSAPFAGGGLPADHPALPADHSPLPADHPANPAAPAEGDAGLTFDTPGGWQPEPRSEMRKAAFLVRNGEQKVEITVIALPLFAGDLLANVNRWRGQVHLGEIKADELTKLVKPISVGGTTGSYVELTGPVEPAPRLALLGVLATRSDRVWFVKLMGDAPLAERERGNFEAFVKTIKFTSP